MKPDSAENRTVAGTNSHCAVDRKPGPHVAEAAITMRSASAACIELEIQMSFVLSTSVVSGPRMLPIKKPFEMYNKAGLSSASTRYGCTPGVITYVKKPTQNMHVIDMMAARLARCESGPTSAPTSTTSTAADEDEDEEAAVLVAPVALILPPSFWCLLCFVSSGSSVCGLPSSSPSSSSGQGEALVSKRNTLGTRNRNFSWQLLPPRWS